MKKKDITYYEEVLKTLKDLKKLYPGTSIGTHLSIITSEYGDLANVSDRELSFALEKYKSEMEIYGGIDIEIDKIISDGQNLDTLFNEPDEEEDEL